jgi:SAM-dependent methyltransferase
MPVHPQAAGFDLAAESYEAGRPIYPEAAIDWLVDALRITPVSRVVDLAAGTGKFTRQLLTRTNRVIAVEPIAGMRRVLAEKAAGAEIVDGTAERLPLPDHEVDAVTVAQAFHWFDYEQALSEIHRVLVEHGRLGLIWNKRDLAQDIQSELQQIIEPNRQRGTPSHETGVWQQGFDKSTLFTPLVSEQFPFEQELDADGLVDRVVSVSFIAQLPEPVRAGIADETRRIASRYGPPIVLRYVTRCYWSETLSQ